MSYIRSGSNPEGLYIVGTKEGVEFYVAGVDYSQNLPRAMPVEVFEGLLRKYHKSLDASKVEYGGATVKEVWIDGLGGNKYRIRLNYKDWDTPIDMYEVTWSYIVR